MKESPTLLLSKMSSLFKIMNDHGINIKEFLSTEGINPLLLDSPDSRICLENVHSIINKAEALTGDRNIGLHQGEIFSGIPSILCYMMMSCTDIGMAIEKLCKYQRITDETKRFDLLNENNMVAIHVTYGTDFYNMNKHLSDYQLCGLYSFLKFISGKELSLEEVRFRHDTPEDISEYQRIFKCSLAFQSKVNAIVLKKDLLKIPLLQPNQNLLALFENHAEKVLKKFVTSESYTKRVAGIVIESIQEQVPSIKAVADQMSTSVRNLQLKLKKEGTTYSKLLNKIRTDLAVEYLKDNHVSITEISYLLGFSEPSVFHHFFKKITGYTPLKYRQKIKDEKSKGDTLYYSCQLKK